MQSMAIGVKNYTIHLDRIELVIIICLVVELLKMLNQSEKRQERLIGLTGAGDRVCDKQRRISCPLDYRQHYFHYRLLLLVLVHGL